nr:thymidylate synthase [uncultured bacterium]AIA14725.1 thymidylate synthase [uncultured bacterium]
MKSSKHPEYQYLNLAKEILESGIKQTDRGTGVSDYSLFGRQSRYDLSEGFPLLTTKKVYWKGVVEELYWFFSGQTNIKYLVDNNVHIWDDYPFKIYKEKNPKSKMTKDEFIENIRTDAKFAKEWGELPRIYGEMWRKWPTRKKGKTIDQLQWAVNELKADPNAHNAIVNSWNPEYLYTMADRQDASRFPICHNMYQISNRNGRLSLILYQRSCDLFLGVPFNIASYSLLALVLAKVLDLEPGEFIHDYGDVHIYENHIDQFKEQLMRKPRPFPTVKLVGKIKELSDFTPDKVVLENYDPHPTIKAELTVAGGYYESKKKKK